MTKGRRSHADCDPFDRECRLPARRIRLTYLSLSK
jgi:hypothetical protein